jgi:hypothetical protein
MARIHCETAERGIDPSKVTLRGEVAQSAIDLLLQFCGELRMCMFVLAVRSEHRSDSVAEHLGKQSVALAPRSRKRRMIVGSQVSKTSARGTAIATGTGILTLCSSSRPQTLHLAKLCSAGILMLILMVCAIDKSRWAGDSLGL